MKPIPVGARRTTGAEIARTGPETCRLVIPPGPRARYRLAQLDDYTGLKRTAYHWEPPVDLSLQARAGSDSVPGTWGFGFWNAPMSFSLGLGPASPFPALPNAAWFFHGSDSSYLSFRDDLPGHRFRAQTFRSRSVPAWWALPGLAAGLLLVFPPAARRIRRFMSRKLIAESGAAFPRIDVTSNHAYLLEWRAGSVRFEIDGETVHETAVVPRPPLALVIWIDNQFAAFGPDGRLRYGLHATPEPVALEITEARVNGRRLGLEPAGSAPSG